LDQGKGTRGGKSNPQPNETKTPIERWGKAIQIRERETVDLLEGGKDRYKVRKEREAGL